MSVTCNTPTPLASLTLQGPAKYVVTATGTAFTSNNVEAIARIELDRDGSRVGIWQEVRLASGGSLPNMTPYVINRVISVSGPSQTIAVSGCRDRGDTNPLAFDNTLTAVKVGSATGAQ
jgi:hypothetical protein